MLYKESEKNHSQSDDICVLQAVSLIVLSTFAQCKVCIIVTSPTLTEGLLVHYEAADNAFIAAAEGEAVASEDDV